MANVSAGSKGRYEWWYFDAHLNEGVIVAVVFYTKPNVSPNGPLAPRNFAIGDDEALSNKLRSPGTLARRIYPRTTT
jgi:hypothetical protein